jgi:hypothetical protein
MNERKVFDDTSEEDDAKEICDNEASDEQKCGFSFVK